MVLDRAASRPRDKPESSGVIRPPVLQFLYTVFQSGINPGINETLHIIGFVPAGHAVLSQLGAPFPVESLSPQDDGYQGYEQK